MNRNSHVPYSRRALENLSVALGVNSAYLWIDPARQSLGLKKLTDDAVASPELELAVAENNNIQS